MSVSFEDIQKANDTIKTTGIERKDKNGKTVVKEYAEVNQRVKAFKMIYPEGSILTELVSNENGICIFKTTILNQEGKILATGTAYEKENASFINKTSYIENCETSAVGRALGLAGFGIDTSIRSAEEMQNAELQQELIKPITEKNVTVLQGLIKELQDAKPFYDSILTTYKIKDLSELNTKQYGEILIEIKKLKGE